MQNPKDEFKEGAFHVLGHFQVIESILKTYIAISYIFIKHRTKGLLHFDFSEKDVQDLPLGRLIVHFEKLNENKELHKLLRGIVKDRNDLAHKGFLPGLVGTATEADLQKLTTELHSINQKLTKCFAELGKEVDQLKAKAVKLGFELNA
jgi:hypothetical protein